MKYGSRFKKMYASKDLLLPVNTKNTSTIERFSVWGPFLKSYYQTKTKPEIFNNLQSYCMFIGYPRSGHSFLGSLIDAHPNAIIAHELDTLQFIDNSIPFSRDQIFYLLLANSRQFAQHGRTWCGYSYEVPGQQQGKYQKLLLIGDKKGGISTIKLGENIELINKLKAEIKLPIKTIHVIRNPFDNISTIAIKEGRTLQNAIDYYFKSVDINYQLKNKMDVYDVRLEKMINNPKRQLKGLCNFLNLECGAEYINACAKITKLSPNKSRHKINWSPKEINKVNNLVTKYDFLKNYSFSN